MANYLKKIVLADDNLTNTNLENSLTSIRTTFNNQLRLNFQSFINDTFNLHDQQNLNLTYDTDFFINISQQYINICIIKDLPNVQVLIRENGTITHRLSTGRAAPTFIVYNTQTRFGAFAQYEDSLNLYNLNQLLTKLIRHTGQNVVKQEIFQSVMNSTDAQSYIRNSVNEIKKIIIELTPEESPINLDEFEPLQNTNVRYLQEIDLSVFDNDIRAFMNYLNQNGILQRVIKYFCRSNEGRNRVINVNREVKDIPDNFNIGECIIELSNLAVNNLPLTGFQNMNIFNTLRGMTAINHG